MVVARNHQQYQLTKLKQSLGNLRTMYETGRQLRELMQVLFSLDFYFLCVILSMYKIFSVETSQVQYNCVWKQRMPPILFHSTTQYEICQRIYQQNWAQWSLILTTHLLQ